MHAGVFNSCHLEGPCQLYLSYHLICTPYSISSSYAADAEYFELILIMQVSYEKCNAVMSMNLLWGLREAFGKLWGETEQL